MSKQFVKNKPRKWLLEVQVTPAKWVSLYILPVPHLVAFLFLGGLSLHLNHLIGSRVRNYNWPFGTLPFGLFGSNLDTMDLETYPRTYFGHF